MCCTFTKSTMSKTRIYVGEAQRAGKHVHVMAYQNVAKTLGPNAMVLPFPTDVPMGPGNMIDTRKFKSFLKDISEASREITKGFSADGMRGATRGMTLGSKAAQVFDVGSYTVVLADDVSQIPEALTRVPAHKRPSVSTKFIGGYGDLYPDDPIAVCCWNGSIEAEPLMWWYQPRNSTELFIPTMDAHDGGAPQLREVQTDHIISVGSVGPTGGHQVRYSSQEIPAAVQSLLPSHVYGHKLPTFLENGDCFVKTASLHQDKGDRFTRRAQSVIIERGNYVSRIDSWS